MALQTILAEDSIAYTGEQLQAGWAAARFGLDAGADCAVAFIGSCDVDPRYMVDLEDLAAGSRIYSEEMAHFIIERVGRRPSLCALRPVGERPLTFAAGVEGDPSTLSLRAKGRVADIEKAVLHQRLLVCIVADMLNARIGSRRVQRRGNDLYDGTRKLSVSVATVSPRSELIHFGINVHTSDYPLPVKGIADYGVDPRAFAAEMLAAYRDETDDMLRVRRKVRPVGEWPRATRH